MNIYIDESGSINNKFNKNKDFIITLIVTTNKKSLERPYKRFISSNLKILKLLDKDNRMFLNGKFHELKGSQFDKPMKQKFVQFFSEKKHFEIYYIRIKILVYQTIFVKILHDHLTMCYAWHCNI